MGVVMPLLKLSRVLMLGCLSFSTVAFTAQVTEQGRLTPPQSNAGPLQPGLALGMGTPTFINREATDSTALENSVNNLEGLHISQNRLTAPKSDRDVLIEFYNATDGDNWKSRTNWKSNKPISQWYGITTDSSGRVTKLDLEENQLTGSIPAALGNLNNLEELWLHNNQLTRSIPAALGNLNNLEKLVLSSNQLTGSIPMALGNLNNLAGLWLDNNQLTGSIPAALGNLHNL
ncbi:MAG: hypothetical protein ERJ67_05675, partial [Aphanocapsa feldmannii 277cV]